MAKYLQEHWRKNKRREREKIRDKTVVTAAFNLEQVLLSPHGSTSAFYYSHRLKSHNSTVTEIDNMNIYLFLFVEWMWSWEGELWSGNSTKKCGNKKSRRKRIHQFICWSMWRAKSELNDDYSVVKCTQCLEIKKNWVNISCAWSFSEWK